VVAQTLGVDMTTAYDYLLDRTLATGSTVSDTARAVIRAAHER